MESRAQFVEANFKLTSFVFYEQRWYFLLCCNFKEELRMWNIGNRKRHVLWDIEERMSWVIRGNSQNSTWKGKKSVGFAWRWTARLYCLIAVILCVWGAIRIGKRSVFFLWFPDNFCISHLYGKKKIKNIRGCIFSFSPEIEVWTIT